MVKAKVVVKKKVVTEKDLDKEISALEATDVAKEAEKTLSFHQLRILKRIAYYVGKVGIELDEACELIGVDPMKFGEEMASYPIMRKIIDMKELEYKKDLMATLSVKARAGDDKLAQWLLETKDPDKYGRRKKGDPDGALHDLMATAIEFVQSSEATPDGTLIKKTSGRAFIVQQNPSQLQSKSQSRPTERTAAQIISEIHRIAAPKRWMN